MYTIKRFNGVVIHKRARIIEDFCLLIVLYVLHCFCIPIFYFVLSALNRFRKNCKFKYYELLSFGCKKENRFTKDKGFLSKLFFLLKEQATYNFLLQGISYRTVSHSYKLL